MADSVLARAGGFPRATFAESVGCLRMLGLQNLAQLLRTVPGGQQGQAQTAEGLEPSGHRPELEECRRPQLVAELEHACPRAAA